MIFVRYLKKQYRKCVLDFSYRRSGNAAELQKLKNKYLGRRCFIIGNGPSLTVQDLESLKNEVTFATNRIHNLYGKTQWRPKYYCCYDVKVIKEDIDELIGNQYEADMNFLPWKAAKISGADSDKVSEVKGGWAKSTLFFRVRSFEEPGFSDDISKYVYKGGSITNGAIQIACYLGFNEIYLIGVDHNFPGGFKSRDSFHADGIKPYSFDSSKGSEMFDFFTLWYQATRQYCDKNGIKVYNATRGGALEVFERVDFDDLLHSLEHL